MSSGSLMFIELFFRGSLDIFVFFEGFLDQLR